MRSVIFLRLALGLLAVDSAVAGPCRISETTLAGTSTVSVDTSSVSSVESSTFVESSSSVDSATSSATASSSVEISASSTVTSVETSASPTFTESSVETSASSATTTTTTPTNSTESVWVPIPTFSVLATGQGPVEGKGLRTSNADSFSASFDPDFGLEVRPFTIDDQGRMINDQGWYLCGQYAGTIYDPNAPAEVVTCDSEQPLTRAFLTCAQTEDRKVTCSIPAIICEAQPGDLFFATCEPAPGTWDNLYTRNVGPGYVLNIGDSSAPDYYYPIELSVEAA
ncbi:hypothetical protein B0J15DRAFT_411237 [Fusarium solani]|uniref:Uncharacterized protein n=1 Tax=Fusarium solani TaxID=169388 RepID=A0A9P9JRQ0_FUSSL|nr:uncharacterized protein B0J15DRAFT_411237 [Fusarium solani]KAH7228417.1 hypothetical protein B0J15DRAFT_411237 [Fusarium solani]